MRVKNQNEKRQKKQIPGQPILRHQSHGVNRLLSVMCILLLFSCNTKVKVEETATQYFTINGKELMSDVTGIPDSLDPDVFQASANEPITFHGDLAAFPDDNQWYIDGNLIEKGKNQFEYSFEFPGLYQIKHCHGAENCATRYLYVRKPGQLVEEPLEIENVV